MIDKCDNYCNNCIHKTECNYDKRYDYLYTGIIDYHTDETYDSYKDITDLLNKKEEEIDFLIRKYLFLKRKMEGLNI